MNNCSYEHYSLLFKDCQLFFIIHRGKQDILRFFAPVFLLIPGAATTGAFVLVGVFMMDSIRNINLSDISEALPAFITIIMMMLTYSIANGIILGLLCYVFLKLFTGKYRQISLTMYILAVLFVIDLILS